MSNKKLKMEYYILEFDKNFDILPTYRRVLKGLQHLGKIMEESEYFEKLKTNNLFLVAQLRDVVNQLNLCRELIGTNTEEEVYNSAAYILATPYSGQQIEEASLDENFCDKADIFAKEILGKLYDFHLSNFDFSEFEDDDTE